AITNRASPLCSQIKTGKNSNRNSVRVLAWWVRAAHASGKRKLIRSVLINGMCQFEDGTRAARRRPIAQTALR
ncbi:MAG TPA: hypothetical protein DE061_05370, partial [Clostridiales bacterium]|nr:hypothetical protein [Clostridiales bacterium]